MSSRRREFGERGAFVASCERAWDGHPPPTVGGITRCAGAPSCLHRDGICGSNCYFGHRRKAPFFNGYLITAFLTNYAAFKSSRI